MRHSVRPARASEFADLLALWERSVWATHHFVTEEEIAIYAPLVYASFQSAEIWVVEMPEQNPAGFMLLDGNKVEALFLDPSFLRQGLGQAMIAHARALKGPLQIDYTAPIESCATNKA